MELPPDILLLLYYRTQDVWRDDQPSPLLILSAVCQHWRTVFTGTPFLWTNVSFSMASDFNFERYIAKSFPLLYDLTLDDFNWKRSTRDPLKLERQIQAVAKHINRLRSLHLRFRSHIDLQYFLRPLKNLTADKLTMIVMQSLCGPFVLTAMPGLNPFFPAAPNLAHMVSPGRWAFMFPNPFPSLVTLHLRGFEFSLADFRRLFLSTSNLKTLVLEHGFKPVDDPAHAQNIHEFMEHDLVELPSLQYLSVVAPMFASDVCPCFLPVLHLPNLRVLDVSDAQPCNTGPFTLRHFHPRTVQAWNDPSSAFYKIRLRGSWTWAPSAIFSQIPRDSFTKRIHLELIGNTLITASLPDYPRERFMETESILLRVTGTATASEPREIKDMMIKWGWAWVARVPFVLRGPVTVEIMRDGVSSDVIREVVVECRGRFEIVLSDRRRDIWRDVEEGGDEVPVLIKEYLVESGVYM